jgi:hypothetical protein
VRTLARESAADTLAAIARGTVARCVLPWIPLIRGAAEAGIIEEWKRLGEIEPDEQQRANYGSLALIFVELTRWPEVWREGLKGWNMRQSQIVSEWQAEARREGNVEMARAILFKGVPTRFGVEIPTDLRSRVEKETDAEVLQRWCDLLMAAPTLERFRADINNGGA